MEVAKKADGSISAEITVQDIKDLLNVIPISPIKIFIEKAYFEKKYKELVRLAVIYKNEIIRKK